MPAPNPVAVELDTSPQAREKAPTRRTPRFSLLFVIGVPQCGSTLLGRLLDSHSQAVCVGEMLRTNRALENAMPCGCGKLVEECDFWRGYLGWMAEANNYDYRKFTSELYRRIAKHAGKELIVDLSKSRVWRLTRWWRNDDVGYIFLARDTRGVMGSAARRGRDLGTQLRRHRKWMNRYSRYIKRKKENGLLVRYEDFCRQPESELRRICTFVGLDFEAAMLEPAAKQHHFIHSSMSPYLKGTNEIRLDERWREDLSPYWIAEVERTMKRIDVFRDGS